jgi:hypothetical protein
MRLMTSQPIASFDFSMMLSVASPVAQRTEARHRRFTRETR